MSLFINLLKTASSNNVIWDENKTISKLTDVCDNLFLHSYFQDTK